MRAPPPAWFPWDGDATNAPGARSAAEYERVVKQFNVATCPRYAVTVPGVTYCNIFAWDVTRAMGAEIPHWVEREDLEMGKPIRVELNCTKVIKWLEAGMGGWREVSQPEATHLANAGYPTVVTWLNPDPNHSSHIAMVVPGPDPNTTRITQAGAENFECDSVGRGFGHDKWPALRWWTHD